MRKLDASIVIVTTHMTSDPTVPNSEQSDTISLESAVSPQLGQGTSVEYLRDLVQKRHYADIS